MLIQKTPPSNLSRCRGLSLVEVLACATIACLLLTATGVAYLGSMRSFRDNQDRAQLLSSGRLALHRLIYDIRAGDAHSPYDPANQTLLNSQFAAGQITTSPGILIIKQHADAQDPNIVKSNPATWVTLIYSLNSATKQLTLSKQTGSGPVTTTTVSNFVQDFNVQIQPARSTDHVTRGLPDYDILLRAVVNLTLQNHDATGKKIVRDGSGENIIRLTDAAMPRRTFNSI